MAKFNVNVNCRVKLTDLGKKTLADYWDSYEIPQRYRTILIDGDIFEDTLWAVMRIFGPVLYNGAVDMPFVDNEIEVL